MDDLEFVQSCISGNRQSWDEFLDRYKGLIYATIRGVLNTKGLALASCNSSDIFQDIIYSLIKDNFKKLKTFQARNGCSLATWLRQVALHFTIDYTRKLKPAVSIDQENEDGFSLKDILSDGSATVRDVISEGEKLNQLRDCIDKLDTDDKYFIALHLYRGFSLEKLSEHLRITRQATDMRKSRILKRLKECFKGKGFKLDF